MNKINEARRMKSMLRSATEAMDFAYKHLSSMENYSLVTGARHELRKALQYVVKDWIDPDVKGLTGAAILKLEKENIELKKEILKLQEALKEETK